jgi:hypothetical protein
LVLCFIYFGKFIHSIVSLYMLLKNALEQFVFFCVSKLKLDAGIYERKEIVKLQA